MNTSTKIAADALEKFDFDENAAMNFILEEREREEERLNKKKEQDRKKQ